MSLATQKVREKRQQRDQLRLQLTQIGTELDESRADYDQWRQQAMHEMQLLQVGIDSVIMALRQEMQCRYSELNK